jgi:ubiquinone/menaquinone biosynthesis C-methylase UbiE
MQSTNYLSDVKAQYEALPYPPCDPEDDQRRLMRTWLDSLAMINHYCFKGRETFTNGFRVLVAGAGTGDSTIYLAEQLRHTDARIVHLDLSGASLAIAKRRAQIRGLANIEWLQQSLLDLPALGLDKFDYINCSGVLHHLAVPDAGLRALRSVL